MGRIEYNVSLANNYIVNKHLLGVKNKTLAKQLFTLDKDKALVIKNITSINPYICYGSYTKDTNEEQLLSVVDLSVYSKTQLILLYEGWHCFDGIDIALFTKNVDGSKISIMLPYKDFYEYKQI